MSYYTTFKFDFQNLGEYTGEMICDHIKLISNHSYFGEVKWYDYKIDMKQVSKAFPEVLMIVSGEGEENDDIWKHYFRNGKDWYTRAILTFPEFKEEYLE